MLAALVLCCASAVYADILLVPNGGVNSPGPDNILKYDLATGASLGVFASAADDFGADNGKGVLQNPTDIAIGPDGKVYVTYTKGWDNTTNPGNGKGGVVRFVADGTYDGLIVDFDTSNPGTAVKSTTSVTFGSDGLMYVGHQRGVKQYTTDGTFQQDVFTTGTNAFVGRDVMALGEKIYFFNEPAVGTLKIAYYDVVTDTANADSGNATIGFPQGLAADSANDRLFALGSTQSGNQNIALWDSPTIGTFDNSHAAFAQSGPGALGMLFWEGKLYVHDGANGNIRILDAATGADEGFLVSGDPNLSDRAWGLAVIPEPSTFAVILLCIPAVLGRRSVRMNEKSSPC